VSFQLSGQIGLIWAVLKLFSKLTAISPAKDNFLYQFSTTYIPKLENVGVTPFKTKKACWFKSMIAKTHGFES
jgi:hypothetical protein